MLAERNGCRDTYLEEDEWWVSGTGTTTEVFRSGTNEWRYFEDLPKDVDHHNVVKLDVDNVIMLGGMETSTDLYLFTRNGEDTGTWQLLNPMPTPRR